MTFRAPGGVKNSYGYHGFSGRKWSDGNWQDYGPTITAGDIVGCGVVGRACFFTKNRDFLGVAFRGVPRGLYPTVSFGWGIKGTVEANFGQSSFRFDLDWERVRRLCR